MKKLSKEEFAKAREYIKSTARDLERTMFEYEFEGGDVDNVLRALSRYHNEDGGYGNAIEPDFRCSASSAIGTTIGIQYLSRLGVDANHPYVRDAFHYLLTTFDSDIHGWESVPIAVNDAPRAIWWNYKEPTGDKTQWANPNPEIIGYFHEYQGFSSHEHLSSLTQYALECLQELPDKMEMHVLLCYLRLAARLPKPEQEIAFKKLDACVQATVSTNPSEWNEYCLLPLQIVNTPESRYAGVLTEAIEHNLDYLIDTHSVDGTWNPTWTWWQFGEDWEEAKMEWKGILTLDNLRILRAFGRIEA